MLVTKLTVRRRSTAAMSEGMVAAHVTLLAGGMVKEREEGGLYHYTCEADCAAKEWDLRGYDLTAREDVEMSGEGLSRLLADLEKL